MALIDRPALGYEGAGAEPGTVPNPIAEIQRAVRRHWLLMGLVVGFGTAASVVIAITLPSLFTAHAQIAIETAQPNPLVPTEPDRVPDRAKLESVAEVFSSEALLRDVIQDLNLDYYPDFNPELRWPGVVARFLPTGTTDSRPATAEGRVAGQLRAVRAALSVSQVGRSNALSISFTARAPELAAEVANRLALRYIDRQVNDRRTRLSRARSHLNRRLETLRAEVEQKERKVQEWRAERRLVEGAAASVLQEQISQLASQISLARADLALAASKGRTNSLGAAAGIATIPEVIESPYLESLKSEERQLVAELMAAQNRFFDGNPQVEMAREVLAQVRARLAEETANIAQSLEVSVARQEQRLADLQAEMERLQGEFIARRNDEIVLNGLVREAAVSRDTYETLLRQRGQLQLQAGIEQSDAHILSLAQVPIRPSKPKRKLIVAGGGVVSVALAFFLVVLLAQIDDTINTIEDVERVSGLQVLAALPKERASAKRSSPADSVVDAPGGAFADALRRLRAKLHVMSERAGAGIVVHVTAVRPGDGASSVACALARTAALARLRVLLIDGHPADPAVGRLTGVEAPVGLLNVLTEGVDLQGAIQVDRRSPLNVLLAGTTKGAVADGLTSAIMDTGAERVLDRIRGEFDFVVIDSPALVSDRGSLMFGPASDAIVLVTALHKTSQRDLVRALRGLSTLGFGREPGLVVNYVARDLFG